jgi:large subunit ribosomal protein L28
MKICLICDKKPRATFSVSHAHNRTKRWVYPNVQKLHFTIVGDSSGKVYHDSVCTKCLKAGKVRKIV